MTVVLDASVVVAALVDDSETGRWAETVLSSGHLSAPHLLPVEVGNILRRAALHGDVSEDIAALAHRDLLALRVALFPYAPFAPRVWELRQNLTAYDAWYVAIAEHLGVPLATLDARLSQVSGPRCEFMTPKG